MTGELLAILLTGVSHMAGGVYLGWRLLGEEGRAEMRGWWTDGGGENPPELDPDGSPQGGGAVILPLDSAAAPLVRLRDHSTLADRLPEPAPHRVDEPERELDPVRQ